MAMNKLVKAAASCLLVASSSMMLLTPTVVHAQTNKRVCGSVYGADSGKLYGLMMEVNKADFVTCAGIIKITSKNATPTNFREMLNHVVQSWRKGWPDVNTVAILRTCEDVTRDWFPPGAYGGDVCHSMQDYRLYYLETKSNRSHYIKKL